MKSVLAALASAPMVFGTAIVAAYDGEPWGGGHEGRGWHGNISERMHETAKRIRSAADRGQISQDEARRLYGELHELRERMQRINYDLDRLNRHIGHEMHEGPPPPPRPTGAPPRY
jgi:hypothetical protein